MYENNKPISTEQERLTAFKRWIYAPFIGKNFMRNLTNSQGKLFHLSVYDEGIEKNEKLIYSNAKEKPNPNPAYTIRKKINVMEQEWLLVWSSTKHFESVESSNEPVFVIIIGILFTGLTALLLVISKIQQTEEKLSPYSKITPLLAFTITFGGAYYLKIQVAQNEDYYIKSVTEKTAKAMAEGIVKSVESKVLALNRMADRWGINNGTPFKSWQVDARNYVRDKAGLKALHQRTS